MPVDPFAVLQALLRAEASRAQRTDRRASEPAAPTTAPGSAPVQDPAVSEPRVSPTSPTRREGPAR
ncbi:MULTISPECIES: hypothetical protein [unclassified Streptomyces]|uniref:hypothetical protein n=1 Tax=unclassified Streptomyces TaxID=2593676 RepID=UPI0006F31392|nr:MULTISPECIES: hypothetical protein [unclassified Streptomyces]KQX50946.1 hypothetical protein ASD33_13130 [Streptomyces sp. Root1304]KRA85112.1 hypothetical protein ASE09_13135 [Streptomyces sp. Root66D1]